MRYFKYFLVLFMVLSIGLGAMGLASAKNEDKGNRGNHYGRGNGLSMPVPSIFAEKKILLKETGNGVAVNIDGATIMGISALSGSGTPDLLTVKLFGQTYKIHAMPDTKILRHTDEEPLHDLSGFTVNEIINASGVLDATDPFLVHAKNINNLSQRAAGIQKKHGALVGEVETVTAPDSFIMETKKGDVAVVTDSNTKIFATDHATQSFGDIHVGMKVLVKGVWDSAINKIRAVWVKIFPL